MRQFFRLIMFAGFLADAYADSASTRIAVAGLLVFAVLLLPALLKGTRDGTASADGSAASQWFPCSVLGAVLLAQGAVLNSCGLCCLGVLGLSHLLLRNSPDVLDLAKTFRVGAVVAAVGLLAVQRVSLVGCGTVSMGQGINILFLIPFWGLGPLLFALFAERVTLRRVSALLLGAAILTLARVAFVAATVSLMRQDAVLKSVYASSMELIAGYALALILFRGRSGQGADGTGNRLGPLAGMIGAAVVVAVSCGGGHPDSRGTERVIIDETHGRWETVDAPFDTGRYGRDTVYNYRLMREWLQNRFQTDISLLPLINVVADVVIIKMPTKMFTEAEKSALRRFVREGGRLLVIGDHTNLFGTADVINDLLEWSGLQLKDDAVVAVGKRHHDMPRRWWNCRPELSGVPYVEFQTGASVVSTTMSGRPLLIANRVVAEKAEYTNERFFGDLVPTLNDRPAPVCMAAVRRWGKGSVTLFSDSTVWSNFSFYAVTNERLFEALLNSGVPQRGLLTVLAMLLVVVVTVAARWRTLPHGAHSALGACVSDVAVAVSLLFLVSETLPACKGRNRALAEKRVVFDARNSSASLRADVRSGGWQDLEDYSTFYAWLSRSGLHPRFELGCAYDDPRQPVLLVDPKPLLGNAEVGRILAYLRSGGRMLVLLEPDASGVIPAGNLLERLGVKIMPARAKGAVCDALSPENNANPLALPFAMLSSGRAAPLGVRMELGRLEYGLSGVTPLSATETGLVMAGEVDFGEGRVTVFARSKLFSEYFFGDVWGGTEPSAEKLQAYRFLDELVNHAFRK